MSFLEGKIDKNTYAQIHKWLKRKFGKADRCENKKCGGKSKCFNWALKNGAKYAFKRKNFNRLCRSCHTNQDFTEETIRKMVIVGRRNYLGKYRTIKCRICKKKIYGNIALVYCPPCYKEHEKEYHKNYTKSNYQHILKRHMRNYYKRKEAKSKNP